MKDELRRLALRDGRYSPEAFHFLFDSLDSAIRLAGKEGAQGPERHVTGQEVLGGMREHALELFGPLSACVWRAWGVRETLDWGRIVFLLVDAGLLKRQEGDTIEDFAAGFDFERAFVQGYRPSLAPEKGGSGEGPEGPAGAASGSGAPGGGGPA